MRRALSGRRRQRIRRAPRAAKPAASRRMHAARKCLRTAAPRPPQQGSPAAAARLPLSHAPPLPPPLGPSTCGAQEARVAAGGARVLSVAADVTDAPAQAAAFEQHMRRWARGRLRVPEDGGTGAQSDARAPLVSACQGPQPRRGGCRKRAGMPRPWRRARGRLWRTRRPPVRARCPHAPAPAVACYAPRAQRAHAARALRIRILSPSLAPVRFGRLDVALLNAGIGERGVGRRSLQCRLGGQGAAVDWAAGGGRGVAGRGWARLCVAQRPGAWRASWRQWCEG